MLTLAESLTKALADDCCCQTEQEKQTSNARFHPDCSFLQLLVLKYVQNKDVFMRYHKAHLTRRLILDISADSEIEENMVEWLRVSSLSRVTEPSG